MTNPDNYNFSALNPRTQRTLFTLLMGFYAGAAHFAKAKKVPLGIAEVAFIRRCFDYSHFVSEPEISKLVASIDKHETSLFSSEMSEKMWNWAMAQEVAPTPHEDEGHDDDDDEDFSFIDEDDALDFLANYQGETANTEDITDE